MSHLQAASRQVRQEGCAVEEHKLAGMDLQRTGIDDGTGKTMDSGTGKTARDAPGRSSSLHAECRCQPWPCRPGSGTHAGRRAVGTPRHLLGWQPSSSACLPRIARILQTAEAVEEEHGVGHLRRDLRMGRAIRVWGGWLD